VSLIYEEGVYKLRGRILGFLLGTGDALLFGRHRGSKQSLLAERLAPPRKLTYITPIFLWLIGFFPVVAFTGEKLRTVVALFLTAYVVLLPVYLLAAFSYNLFVRPRKLKAWENKFLCQRCGTITGVG
jgi:hypothetical protein